MSIKDKLRAKVAEKVVKKTAINKPARSKINYVAGLTALVGLLVAVGLIPEHVDKELLNLLSVAGPAGIMVCRTGFTEPKG